MEFFVSFGDGPGPFHGRFIDDDRVRGTMKHDKVADTYAFEMSR